MFGYSSLSFKIRTKISRIIHFSKDNELVWTKKNCEIYYIKLLGKIVFFFIQYQIIDMWNIMALL